MNLYAIGDFVEEPTDGDGYVVKFMFNGELVATSQPMTGKRCRELVDNINAVLELGPEELDAMIEEDEKAWFAKAKVHT